MAKKMELQTYIPRSKMKRAVGITCLAIAIMPNGLAPVFYPLSFMLLGITMKDVKSKMYDIKVKMRYGL